MIVVSDTGPIVHLHWLGVAAWALPREEIHIVPAVWREIEALAPEVLQDVRLQLVGSTVALDPHLSRLGLDAGELEALSYAMSFAQLSDVIVLCDERAARSVCEVLGLEVRGSVGLIVDAFREGRVSREGAENAIRDLPTRGRCRLSPNLIDEAISHLDSLIQ